MPPTLPNMSRTCKGDDPLCPTLPLYKYNETYAPAPYLICPTLSELNPLHIPPLATKQSYLSLYECRYDRLASKGGYHYQLQNGQFIGNEQLFVIYAELYYSKQVNNKTFSRNNPAFYVSTHVRSIA